MSSPQNASALPLPRLCGWALGFAFRRGGALAAVSGTMLLRVGLDLSKPWPMAFLIDYVLKGKLMPPRLSAWVHRLPGAESEWNLAGWSVAATVVIFLLSWVLDLATTYANINLGQRLTYDLAGALFAKLQQLSLQFHARKSVGDNIRRVITDSTCVSVIVKDALLPLFSSLVSLLAMFCILLQLDATLALLSLAVVPYMMLVFRRYAEPMMTRGYKQQEAEGKIYEFIEQTIAAIPVVQAFGRETLNDRHLGKLAQADLTATLQLTRVQLQFKLLMGLATALGTAAIIWFGAQHALADKLSAGAIVAFLSYLGSFYAPLESIMYTNSTLQGAAGSARRVWEVLQTPTQVSDRPGATAITRATGRVEFETVTFGYEPGRPVLRRVSLAASPGQRVAIVGATGAGKSTLISLIPRFFDPWEGRVLLDGQDLRDLQLKTLRRQVALVLQEPFLFPITIAENIAYGSPEASFEQIQAAARAANAEDFIRRLPQAYQTVVGERGATLSGGERQRISIARALLKNAPVLILDEPTSALDAETEQGLLSALDRLTRDRTTFIIAHRLSTIRQADRILVLHEGEVVESGTHQQLLALRGHYARYDALQSGAPGAPADPRAPGAS